jgi:hypothetical protein
MRTPDLLARLDRRWIFLGMGVAVLVAVLVSPPLGVEPTRPTRGFIESLDALPAGATVLLACDYDPATLPELGPMTRTAFRHLLLRGCRVVVTELWSGAPGVVDSVLGQAARELPGKRYGTDWVDLGYVSGGEAAMALMGRGIAGAFPGDAAGTPLAELPLMRSVRDYSSLALLVSLSAGSPGTREWVQQVQGRFHVPMVAGVTASLAPDCYPYLESGQLRGMLAGMAGAAEYETARNEAGAARRGMGAQSIGHLLVALCIVLGLFAGPGRRSEP